MSTYYGTAACVLLVDNSGRVLSVSRKDNFEKYGIPGGKREPYETYEEAATRELKEETGLRVKNLRKLYEGACVGEGDTYNTVTFVGEYEGKIRTAEPGHVKWLEWDALFDGPFGDYNRHLFEAYQRLNPQRLSMTEAGVA